MYLSWEVGLLRPVAERLRPGRPAVPAVRHADRAGVVHEPFCGLLPQVPAEALTRLLTLR